MFDMDKSFQNTNQDNLNQMRMDFISTVSHELRTPLTSIRGFAETLIASRDKLTDEQQLKFLNIIKDQSNRLINLVENMLCATTQEKNGELYVLKSVNIANALEKVVSVVSQKYPRKDIDIKLHEKSCEVFADEEKFEQILLNLIENACKYSFENSKVIISQESADADSVAISVENDGITIEAKDRDKIFEKFSRLDNPMTRLAQGSGMGLFLASNMAKNMNGEITVESEDEHTVFTLVLPLATPERVAGCRLSMNPKNKGGAND